MTDFPSLAEDETPNRIVYVRSVKTADLPEASGDAIAKEFERYLRRRGTDED